MTDELREFGRAIKWTFPYTNKERKNINTANARKRVFIYSNIARTNTHSELLWGDIFNAYTPPKPEKVHMSWTVSKKLVDNVIQWMIISSDDLCDGKRMVRELRINKDLLLTFLVMGKEVFTLTNDNGMTKAFLDNVFDFCAVVLLCKGFEVVVQGSVKNKDGVTTGETEQWEMCDNHGARSQLLRHRAINCLMICNECESKCRNCERIRSNCHRRLNNVPCSTVDERQEKKKRLSYMSSEELTCRLKEEQTRAKNAEKKAARAIEKKKEIQEQMDEFTEEDHSDFKAMFQREQNSR